MTLPPSEQYAGRKQAYVKHYFLAAYMERLVHKVASSYGEVVYVDGFSGPWQSSGENFSDTSFKIALEALRRAKASWSALGRTVKMRALLVEKSPRAYKALEKLQAFYPDIEIIAFNADFRASVDRILGEIPSGAFAFFLIDPKGWRISMRQIAPLLRRPNSEILFNFMFDFINRAASMRAPATVAGLDELLPIEGWRSRLAGMPADAAVDRAADRKKVLIDAFRGVVSEVGKYRYVAEVPVLYPLRNRLLYSLIYATRRPEGIEVFRDCQIKTLNEQDAVRNTAKAEASGSAGQGEMFDTSEAVITQEFLQREQAAAAHALLNLVPQAPESILWEQVWPQVLALHAVRRTELNKIAARLRQSGQLIFPDWQPKKLVPQTGYRVQRP